MDVSGWAYVALGMLAALGVWLGLFLAALTRRVSVWMVADDVSVPRMWRSIGFALLAVAWLVLLGVEYERHPVAAHEPHGTQVFQRAGVDR